MEFSQNGWPVDSAWSKRKIPGPSSQRWLVVRNDAPGTVLCYLAARFDQVVQDVDAGIFDDWGQAYRPIRGQVTGLSNHASGTAIDLNATQHPLGRGGTFSGAAVAAIHAVLAEVDGAIRWGGDYTGRLDEMHFEALWAPGDGRWAGLEARCYDAIRVWEGGAPAVAPVPTQGPAPTPAVVTATGTLQRGSKGDAVRQVQATLRRNFPLYAKNLTVDGDFGPGTDAAVKEFQRRAGLTADGIVGPQTLRALGL